MKVKGGVWSGKRNVDTEIFGVVPIGGAIVHPCWWRLQPTKGNEVGDLLAHTNSLVQLHNLDGGTQVTPN